MLRITPDSHALLNPNGQGPLIELFPLAAYAVRAPDGVIVWFNSRAAALWGRAPVLGDTDERFCGSHRLFRPDGSYMAHCDTPVALALNTGASIRGEEVVIERPDCTRVTVSVYIDPIYDRSGKIIGAVNFFQDITERTAKDLGRQTLYEEVRSQAERLRFLNSQLQRENWERGHAQASLQTSEDRFRQLAETLEQQIKHRTQQLERRNAEIVSQSEQLRDLSLRLLRAQDDERRRIARELHDSAGQILSVLSVEQARVAKRLVQDFPELSRTMEDLQALTAELTQEIRTASYLLHPPLLDESGLAGALRWYVDGLTARSGLKIDLQMPDGLERFPTDLELVIFRIVQESLTNVIRHSGSTAAAIRIVSNGDHISIEIEDNGKGISPEQLIELQSRGGGVGLRGMRERVRFFHGELDLKSSDVGTIVFAKLPAMTSQISPQHDQARHTHAGGS